MICTFFKYYLQRYDDLMTSCVVVTSSTNQWEHTCQSNDVFSKLIQLKQILGRFSCNLWRGKRKLARNILVLQIADQLINCEKSFHDHRLTCITYNLREEKVKFVKWRLWLVIVSLSLQSGDSYSWSLVFSVPYHLILHAVIFILFCFKPSRKKRFSFIHWKLSPWLINHSRFSVH